MGGMADWINDNGVERLILPSQCRGKKAGSDE